jgi:hypothetical protein
MVHTPAKKEGGGQIANDAICLPPSLTTSFFGQDLCKLTSTGYF